MGKGDVIPSKYDIYRKTVSDLHPDWEIIDWHRKDADHLIATSFPQHWHLWTSYKREIYRIDAFRYFLMYHFGGTYLDQDIEMFRPLSELYADFPECSMFFVQSGHHGNITNYFMSAEPKLDFFKDCIDRLSGTRKALAFFHRKTASYVGVFHLAGPMYLNRRLKRYRNTQKFASKNGSWGQFNPTKSIQADKYMVLPPGSFYSKTKPPEGMKVYGNHDYAFTWNLGTQVLVDVWLVIVFVILLVAVILFCVYLGKTYHSRTKY